MNKLGLCVDRNRPEKCCWCVMKAWDGVLAEFQGFLCADHVRLVHLRHASLHRASTDDLIP